MGIEKIIGDLKRVKGLSNFRILSEKEKGEILKLEESRNVGVMEALKRSYTIALSHDSTFREPAGEIVIKKGKKIIFPPVPFPEVKAKDVASGSPGWRVHELLSKEMELKKDDATLLVGFGSLKEVSDAIEQTKGESLKEQEAIDEKFLKKETDLRVRYSVKEPEININHTELFSYLNTRPTEVSYEYAGLSENKKEGMEVLNYEVMERIVRVRKMEKTIYSGDRSMYIPDMVTAAEIEHFDLYRKTIGFAVNMVMYHLSLT